MKSYVCVLSTDNYLDGVLVLNENLKFHKSKYPLLCLINENIKTETKKILDLFNIKYQVISNIKYNHGSGDEKYWIYTFDKLNVFSLTEYDKIVYLDSDLLILENIDYLFSLNPLSMPVDYPFHPGKYNSGVMVIKPNYIDYINLKKLASISDKKKRNISDQNIINEYFASKINGLPINYNAVRQVLDFKNTYYDAATDSFIDKYAVQNFTKNIDDIKIVHYISAFKPFMIDCTFNDEYANLYNYLLEIIRLKKKKNAVLNSDDLISIIIPVYNAEKYLARCLDSVLNQTYKKLEVILVDDCSQDNSLEICKSYKQHDDRIIIIENKENLGVSKSRNIGINVMHGKYVGFVDSDDFIESNMYEKLLDVLNTYNLDFVQCSAYITNGQKRVNDSSIDWFSNNEQIIEIYLNYDVISSVVWDKLYKRELIEGNYFSEKLLKHEDNKYISNLLKRTERIAIIDDLLYHYHYKRGGSLTSTFSFKNDIVLIEIMKDVEHYVKKKYPKLLEALNIYMFSIYNFFCDELFHYGIEPEYYDEINEFLKEVLNFSNYIYPLDYINKKLCSKLIDDVKKTQKQIKKSHLEAEKRCIGMPKIILIIAYFGKLPNYFKFWLKSVETNPSIDFLLITDDRTEYAYPNNIKVVYSEFSRIRTKIIRHFKENYALDVAISYPYKLCDFKPFYADIFKEYVTGYDFVGFCDLDIIFGDIRKFLNRIDIDNYYKIFEHGHFTLLKNDPTLASTLVNFEPDDSVYHCKECLNIGNRMFHYDEYNGLGPTLEILGKNCYYNYGLVADLDYRKFNFNLLDINFNNDGKKYIFEYNNGSLIGICENGLKKEFMYVHIQKRNMKIQAEVLNKFFIIPNSFVNDVDMNKVFNIKETNNYLEKKNKNDIYYRKQELLNYMKNNLSEFIKILIDREEI